MYVRRSRAMENIEGGRNRTLDCKLHWYPKFHSHVSLKVWALLIDIGISIYLPLSYPFNIPENNGDF